MNAGTRTNRACFQAKLCNSCMKEVQEVSSETLSDSYSSCACLESLDMMSEAFSSLNQNPQMLPKSPGAYAHLGKVDPTHHRLRTETKSKITDKV